MLKILPERWVIKITEFNRNALIDWVKSQSDYKSQYNKFKIGEYVLSNHPVDNSYQLYRDYDCNIIHGIEFTEITFDDFKRLVLKEEPMRTEKTIKLSLDQAKKMYGKNPEMDELLFANFSKEELTKKELPNNFDQLKPNYRGYYITSQGNIDQSMSFGLYKNNFRTEKQARSALAAAQLSQLMAVYNDGWEFNPDGNFNVTSKAYTIIRRHNEIKPDYFGNNWAFLAFKAAELRDEFLKNFELLIKEYFMID